MSHYSEDARSHILDLLTTKNIRFVDIKSSRLSSSIFSVLFWKKVTELLFDEENFVLFNFVLPTNINMNVFEKIDQKIKVITNKEYNKTKIKYTLTPIYNEDETGVRVDGITIITKDATRFDFETSRPTP